MVLGIAGSRSINRELPEEIMPENIRMIISGGAIGIDRCARRYAAAHYIPITEILPEYDLYGSSAPLKRNDIIIKNSDIVYIFWDGKSRGSKYVINKCIELDKPHKIFLYKNGCFSLMK